MRKQFVLLVIVWVLGSMAGAQASINLSGTMLSGGEQLALIEGNFYRVGDTVLGYKISAIDEIGITIRLDGKLETILVDNAKPSRAVSSAKREEQQKEEPLAGYLVLALFAMGAVMAFIGEIWFLVASFRVSILWGLGCFFIPFVGLFFLIKHWSDAAKPFGVSVLGNIMIIVAFILSPDFFQEYLAM